jgi:hypothetical protein
MDETQQERKVTTQEVGSPQEIEVTEADHPKPKQVQHRPTQEEREDFQKEVARLRLDGLSFNKIAEKVGKSKPIVHKAYKDYMQEYRKTHAKDSDVLIGEYHARMERIVNHYLGAYSASIPEGKNTGDVRILRDLAGILGQEFNSLQSTGAIDKVKEQVEHSGVVELQNFVKEFWKKKVPAKAEAKKTP